MTQSERKTKTEYLHIMLPTENEDGKSLSRTVEFTLDCVNGDDDDGPAVPWRLFSINETFALFTRDVDLGDDQYENKKKGCLEENDANGYPNGVTDSTYVDVLLRNGDYLKAVPEKGAGKAGAYRWEDETDSTYTDVNYVMKYRIVGSAT